MKGDFLKKMVARWAKRLKEIGEVGLKSFHPEVKADPIHDEVEVPDRSGHKQLSDIEKGEIKAYYYVDLNYTQIAKRVGRDRKAVRSWLGRLAEDDTLERKLITLFIRYLICLQCLSISRFYIQILENP